MLSFVVILTLARIEQVMRILGHLRSSYPCVGTEILLLLTAMVCLGAISRADAQSYTFTTLAGLAGQSGGSDGTNSAARFNAPAGITVDRSGNLYTAEILNHTIRKITPVGTNWVVSTIAGLTGVPGWADGTNSEARFNRPNGITVDAAGNLFVVDHYNHTIRKMVLQGTNWVVSTVAGLAGQRNHDDGTNSTARFYSPTGIAVDDAGNLNVTDTLNFTIRKIAPVGTDWVVTTPAGVALNYGFSDGTNSAAQFDFPYDITWNAGKFYVSDWGNHAIRQIAISGTNWIVTTIAGYSGDFGSVDGTGKKAKFYFPNGIASDQEGVVYVADQNNHTIRRLTPPPPSPPNADWMVSTIGGMALQLGSSDGTGSSARFNKPWGITVDRAGNIYVADYSNNTIRKGVPPWGPIPTLQIELAGNQAVISWPGSASNYVLETRGTLLPGQPWSSLTNDISLVSGRFVLSHPLTAASSLYRLRRL